MDFLVTTLWAHIDPSEAYMTEHGVNDFYRILRGGKRLSAEGFNAEHERCVDFLKAALAGRVEPSYAAGSREGMACRKVVVSHHVPTMLCMAQEFRGSSINGAFVCEMGDLIASSDIDVWIYGHSHRNIDAVIERVDSGVCRIVTNQLGYVAHGEHLRCGFEAGKVIEI